MSKFKKLPSEKVQRRRNITMSDEVADKARKLAGNASLSTSLRIIINRLYEAEN